MNPKEMAIVVDSRLNMTHGWTIRLIETKILIRPALEHHHFLLLMICDNTHHNTEGPERLATQAKVTGRAPESILTAPVSSIQKLTQYNMSTMRAKRAQASSHQNARQRMRT